MILFADATGCAGSGPRAAGDQSPGTLWTIGHWTCPKPAFLHPLLEQDIELLVDVRALRRPDLTVTYPAA